MQTSKLLRKWHPVHVVSLYFVVLFSFLVAAPRDAQAQEYVLPTPLDPQDLSRRLQSAQTHIDALLSERPGIAGPVVVLALGTALALLPPQMIAYSYDPPDQDAHARRSRRILGSVSIAGGVMAIGGTAWLIRRVRQRASVNGVIQELKRERKALIRALRELDYDARAGVDGMHFLARGRF